MKEEKEGVLHIIFIFVGLCLICLGAFYYFTDDKINLNQNNNKNNNVSEDKDVIGQINLMNNIETSVTLKNKKNIRLKYIVSEETNKGSLIYNGMSAFETSSDLENCDEFYIYNDSIIASCYYGSATSGHLYIIDSSGKSTLIEKFDNNKMIPESIQLKNEKIIVNGMRIYEGDIIKVDDKEILLCNEEEIVENNIDLKQAVYADYELVIKKDKPEFIYIKTTKTLEEFINESCKIVE